MRIPLEGDEHVVVRTRRHARALRGPVWGLLLLMFFTGCVLGFLTRVPSLGSMWTTADPYLVTLTWILAGLGFLAWVLVPLGRWVRIKIIITTRRVLILSGRRTVSQLPLEWVEAVRAKTSLGARNHGPGTLELRSMRGRLLIHHCPDVARASELIEQLRARLPQPSIFAQAPTGPGLS